MGDTHEGREEVAVDPRLIRLRVELFTAMQTLKGADLEYFNTLIAELVLCMGIERSPTSLLDSAAAAAPKRSHISVQYDLHRKMLERAEVLLENNNHTEACELVNAAMRLRP